MIIKLEFNDSLFNEPGDTISIEVIDKETFDDIMGKIRDDIEYPWKVLTITGVRSESFITREVSALFVYTNTYDRDDVDFDGNINDKFDEIDIFIRDLRIKELERI